MVHEDAVDAVLRLFEVLIEFFRLNGKEDETSWPRKVARAHHQVEGEDLEQQFVAEGARVH